MSSGFMDSTWPALIDHPDFSGFQIEFRSEVEPLRIRLRPQVSLHDERYGVVARRGFLRLHRTHAYRVVQDPGLESPDCIAYEPLLIRGVHARGGLAGNIRKAEVDDGRRNIRIARQVLHR